MHSVGSHRLRKKKEKGLRSVGTLMLRGRRAAAFVLFLLIALGVPSAQAVELPVVFPFEIFTDNGDYSDGSLVDLSVEVFNGEGIAKFTFYNDSSVECSITKIFFDDGTLLGIDYIENGIGTDFDRAVPGPGDLPGGNLLDPPFVADREFNVGADNPPYHNGVNNIGAGEYVTVTFDLINGGHVDQVIGELYNGTLRIGIHVQGFPDGSSESAVHVPEPATVLLFGIGTLVLLRRRKV